MSRPAVMAIVALTIVAAGVIGGKRFLLTPASIHAATTTVGPAQSYLVILGANDTADTNWDGSITVTGASVEILRGWRWHYPLPPFRE